MANYVIGKIQCRIFTKEERGFYGFIKDLSHASMTDKIPSA